MELALAQPRLVALLAALSAFGWAASMLVMPHAHCQLPAGARPVEGAGLPLLFVMWSTMMVGMMVPPEAKALLRLSQARRSLAPAGAFLAGFLLPWMIYSLAAAALQTRLQAAGLMDHEMATTSGALAGALLLAAGVWKVLPLESF